MTTETITLPARSTLTPGQRVRLSVRTPGGPRNQYTLAEGVIAALLTRTETHPHGILVRTQDGRKGRVWEVLAEAPPALTPERLRCACLIVAEASTARSIVEATTADYQRLADTRKLNALTVAVYVTEGPRRGCSILENADILEALRGLWGAIKLGDPSDETVERIQAAGGWSTISAALQGQVDALRAAEEAAA